jgi:hypothetical protein
VPHSNLVLFDVRVGPFAADVVAPARYTFSQGKSPPQPSLGTTLHKSAEGEATRHDSLDQPVICAGSVVGQAYTGEQVLEAGVGAEVIDP